MGQLNLGRVRGKDGGFGNVTSEYRNDGGDPNVDIVVSGEETAKDFRFVFSNLVNNPIDSATIDRITNNEIVSSADVLNATGLTTLWGKIVNIFAPKAHVHGTSGLSDLAVTTAKLDNNSVTQEKLADHCVGQNQLETGVWDSISQEESFTDRTTTNLLQVSLNDRAADINKPCKISTDNAAELENRADGMPTSGSFVAYRRVYWFAPTHILVVIIEAYPIPGRTWANFYNTTTWSGWKEH